jgi:hypothetical protein
MSLFIPDLKKMIEEEGQSPNHVFNVDATWPSSTTRSLYL